VLTTNIAERSQSGEEVWAELAESGGELQNVIDRVASRTATVVEVVELLPTNDVKPA
jgi:hypothetical protein